MNIQRREREKTLQTFSVSSPECSLFVRLFLGQVNVKQYRDGERNHLKLVCEILFVHFLALPNYLYKEYEKFKRRTNVLLLAFVFVQFFMTFRPVEIIFQVFFFAL